MAPELIKAILGGVAMLGAFGAPPPEPSLPEVSTLGERAVFYDRPWYELDPFASDYLPADSKAWKRGGGRYWCGTPIVQFLHSGDTGVPESLLIERAKALQAMYAPEELDHGPAVSIASCQTFRCLGVVDLAVIFSRWEFSIMTSEESSSGRAAPDDHEGMIYLPEGRGAL